MRMAYRLSLADDVPSSVRACAREQLARAAQQLADPRADPVDAVHEVRKHLKKTRSLLRLARPALGRHASREHDAQLRELGLALSGARDADVLVETVAQLAEHAAGRLPAIDFEELRASFAGEAAAARAAAAAGGAHDDVGAKLHAAAEQVGAWPLDGAGWDDLVAGAARAYGRGRDALAAARDDPTDERMHAWRKRVKDLWYHQRLLAPAWPPVLGAQAEEAHALSELLGDDHDLALLRARIEHGTALGPAAGADAGELLALVDARREQLRTQAWPLGERLYAERPKAFARRLRRILRSAAEQQRAPDAAG
jgi:CHAD domain-containing protein